MVKYTIIFIVSFSCDHGLQEKSNVSSQHKSKRMKAREKNKSTVKQVMAKFSASNLCI